MELFTINTVNCYNNSSPVSLKSSPMKSSNAVPNTSHIMQSNPLDSPSALKSATSIVNNDVQLYLFVIVIKSHPNPSSPPSESNLKCVEHYIRNEASKMEGFDADSFNMRYNGHTKKHQCYVNFATAEQAKQASEIFNVKIHGCQLRCKYNEPVKENNEINPVKVRSISI